MGKDLNSIISMFSLVASFEENRWLRDHPYRELQKLIEVFEREACTEASPDEFMEAVKAASHNQLEQAALQKLLACVAKVNCRFAPNLERCRQCSFKPMSSLKSRTTCPL